MGTNFYFEPETAPPDCFVNNLHLGKRSAGWKFLHSTDLGNNLGTVIGNLETIPGHVVNEYGETMDCVEFLAMVRSWNSSPTNLKVARNSDTHWLDLEGNAFHHGEFC